jgi:hypothetical protein
MERRFSEAHLLALTLASFSLNACSRVAERFMSSAFDFLSKSLFTLRFVAFDIGPAILMVVMLSAQATPRPF